MIAVRNILVPTDFSECARAAMAHGRMLAQTFDASLHILHVVTEPLHEPWSGFVAADALLETVNRSRRTAFDRLEHIRAGEAGVIVATTWGDASDEILEYARRQQIDLIVCGTRGLRGWNHLLMGSVAERIVRLAACPVLTVHAPGAGAAAA